MVIARDSGSSGLGSSPGGNIVLFSWARYFYHSRPQSRLPSYPEGPGHEVKLALETHDLIDWTLPYSTLYSLHTTKIKISFSKIAFNILSLGIA